jgi:peptide/nickel transport system substrate-binding protein
MTAEDVKYNYVRVMKAGLTNAYLMSRFMSNPDKQIQIVDPYTFRFSLGRPQPLFLGAAAQYVVPVVLDAHALKAHATRSDPWAHNWATDHDAGTGPYRIRTWTHAQQVTLARFPGYWGGWSGPHFSMVVVRTIPEASTRRELMERGQADLTHDLTPQDYQALSQTPTVRVLAPYGTEVQYVVMTEAGPLASPYARQALAYAFNYDAFLTAAYHGYARRAYGPLASTLLGYDPHMFHYQTDLARARALLRKAGVKPGTTLTYMYTPGLPWAHLAGLILQAQLAQLGVTVKLAQVDLATYNSIFFGKEPAGKRPNLLPFFWFPDYDDPYDQCVPLVASYSAGAAGGNAGYYHNKEVDALLAQMKNAGRTLLIRDAHKLQDITGRVDPPAIWIAEPAQVTVLARSLKGYVFNPLQLQTYYVYTMHR